MADVVVIGAGIVGAATAIWLRRAGHEVTLIDKGKPGMGTSYGNACLLASCAVVPVTTPGLVMKGPKYLLDPNFPLFMRWPYLPKLLPWLTRYLAHANDGDTRRIAHALSHVIGDSLEQHQALTKGTRAEKWIQESTYSFAYKNRAAFEADRYGFDLRRELGFSPDVIEGAAVHEAEPILAPDINLLAVFKNHGFILNPASYVQDLVELLQELGGRFVESEVRDFDLSGDRIRAVETDTGRFNCDRAVLSAGIWSKPLMAKLGLKIPLEAERGYHMVFKSPSAQPKAPIMLASGKFVATPMDQGLRCAGIVEFGGLNEQKSKAPLEFLRRQVAACFPNLTYEGTEDWVGFRPSTPDSLPVIGEIGTSGVYTAFGHQHIGLTGGAKTGRWVADLISGETPNVDMTPYSPMRYSR